MGAGSGGTDLRTLKLAVALYAVMFAMKLVVYLITGVMALLGEALHTFSDILIFGFLLVAATVSRRRADQVHMFGYGRAQNVAALIAAVLFISFTSYKLYEEAIPRLLHPAAGTYSTLWLALAVIILSMLIAAVPLIALLRQPPREAAARAQLMGVVNDELGLGAALIGTLLIARGYPVADPIATILVASVVAFTAVGLLRENSSFLLGRAPGPEFLAEVERAARSVAGVAGVHDLRAEYIGPEVVHVGMHVEVDPVLPIRDADRIVREVDERVHARTASGYCVIRVEPAGTVHAARAGAA